jgi:hypothetical protein
MSYVGNSVADPDNFFMDPELTFQIDWVQIRILAHKNGVQTFSNMKSFV